jgi:hypothetical protein
MALNCFNKSTTVYGLSAKNWSGLSLSVFGMPKTESDFTNGKPKPDIIRKICKFIICKSSVDRLHLLSHYYARFENHIITDKLIWDAKGAAHVTFMIQHESKNQVHPRSYLRTPKFVTRQK